MRAVLVAGVMVLLAVVCGTVIFLLCGKNTGNNPVGEGFVFIAHAGGGHVTGPYTNSIRAMSHSYALGFRLFEIDIVLTDDERIVCGHPWVDDDIFSRMSHDDFLTFNSMQHHERCDFDAVSGWLQSHPNARIILDVKDDHMATYTVVMRDYSYLAERLIPQVYYYNELEMVDGLGFGYTIYTLYKERKSERNMHFIRSMIASCKNKKRYGVAVSVNSIIFDQQLVSAVARCGNDLFLHTINSDEELDGYRQVFPVKGVYTDTLEPEG